MKKQHHQPKVHKNHTVFNYALFGVAMIILAFLIDNKTLVTVTTPAGYQNVDDGMHAEYQEPVSEESEEEYAEAVIKIQNGAFVPETLEVAAGTIIAFENEEPVPHHVVSDNYGNVEEIHFDTGVLPIKKKVPTIEYGIPGVYSYHDKLNPQIKGKIVVK